jgi:hypothetical protein
LSLSHPFLHVFQAIGAKVISLLVLNAKRFLNATYAMNNSVCL